MKNYDDIINLPHHVSSKRPQMQAYNRAAQFAPFAALTGYNDAIKETERQTERKIVLDDNAKNILNNKLQILNSHIKDKPEITITYFIPDKKKYGGSYKTITRNLRKIDSYKQIIVLEDKTKISLNDIYNIEINLINQETK